MTPHTTTTTQAADRGLFSCLNCHFCGEKLLRSSSGTVYGVFCLYDDGSTSESDVFEPSFASQCQAFSAEKSPELEPLQDDSEILRVKIGTADTMAEPTAMVRLPITSIPMISKILRNALTMRALTFEESEAEVQAAYDLAVWIDLLEGTARCHAEYEREMAACAYGGL